MNSINRVFKGALTRPGFAASLCAALVLVACNTDTKAVSDSIAAESARASSPAPMPEPAPAPAVPPAAAGEWTPSVNGVHGARVGMTSAETRAALGLPAGKTFAAGTCEYLDAKSLPKNLWFMMESDTLTRIDVRDSTVTTEAGARIGDTEARINELYAPNVRTEPHKYTGPVGHYMIVTPPGDAVHLIVFETDGQRVLRWRVGRKPAVQYVESCS